MEKDRSGIMLYLDREDIETLDNFIRVNKRLFSNRQSVFRYIVNNLDELATVSSVVTHTDTLKLRELEKENAILKERIKGFEKQKNLLEKLTEIEETIDVIEVVVSSDFLFTNNIQKSKNTKIYHEALTEVKRRKDSHREYSNSLEIERDHSNSGEKQKIFDSW